jgi:hypothetical protein
LVGQGFLLYRLSQIFCQLFEISSSCTFLINCLKTKCWKRTAYFFCQAVDIFLSRRWHFRKCVEQSSFEQMDFEQMTPSL